MCFSAISKGMTALEYREHGNKRRLYAGDNLVVKIRLVAEAGFKPQPRDAVKSMKPELYHDIICKHQMYISLSLPGIKVWVVIPHDRDCLESSGHHE
jgi:hypothetical protein